MPRRFGLLVSLFAIVATLALGSPAASARPQEPEHVGPMAIVAFTYVPSVVVARPNERIRVISVDGRFGIPHSVTGPGFNTGIFTGTSAFRAPGRRGLYPMHCLVHFWMRGVLLVR
jgi:hypothetical protein